MAYALCTPVILLNSHIRDRTNTTCSHLTLCAGTTYESKCQNPVPIWFCMRMVRTRNKIVDLYVWAGFNSSDRIWYGSFVNCEVKILPIHVSFCLLQRQCNNNNNHTTQSNRSIQFQQSLWIDIPSKNIFPNLINGMRMKYDESMDRSIEQASRRVSK